MPLEIEYQDSLSAASSSSLRRGATSRARIERRHYAYGIVALILSAIGMGAWLGQRVIEVPPTDASAIPPASAPTLSSQAIATPMSSESTPAPIEPAPPAVATTSAAVSSPAEQVALLLFGASSDVEALRLMSPPGQNAYEKYRAVLNIEPHNSAARQGLAALSDRYLALAYQALDAQRLERAATYIDKAATAAPDNAALGQARRALAARRAALESPDLPVIAPRSGAPIIEKSSHAAGTPPRTVRGGR